MFSRTVFTTMHAGNMMTVADDGCGASDEQIEKINNAVIRFMRLLISRN